jgi:hypothetical protein
VKKLILWLLAGLPACAFGQGILYTNHAWTAATNVPVGAQAPILSVPNALVTVCVLASSPCTSVPIYSDVGLTLSIAQPLVTDRQGNFTFYVATGTYSFTVTSVTGKFLGTYPMALGGGGGGSGTPAGPTTSLQYNNAGVFGGLSGLVTDTTTKQLLAHNPTNYVALANTGQVTNGSFPAQIPNTITHNVTQSFGPDDTVETQVVATNIKSGFRNSDNFTAESQSRQMNFKSWTTSQAGGIDGHTMNCYAVGDCIFSQAHVSARGGGRGTDESTRLMRWFGDISNDYAGRSVGTLTANAVNDVLFNTTAASLGGFSTNFAEWNFIADITQKTSLGNIAQINTCADSNYLCYTLATPHTLGTTTTTKLTAPVDSKAYSGTCPTHVDTGVVYPRIGNNIGGGFAFITNPDGTGTPQMNGNYVNAAGGALTGYCFTVASTAGMTNGTYISLTGSDYNFEFDKIISVVDATHFTAVVHTEHLVGEDVTFGNPIGYGIGADADIVPAYTMNTTENQQATIQRLVYPIVQVPDSTHIQVWIDRTGNSYATRALSANTPAVAMTVTATGFSAGTITGLTTNANNYFVSGGGGYGLTILPPPVVTPTTNCSVAPVIGFRTVGYNAGIYTYTPYIVSGGTGSCTTATFAVASTAPNVASSYPIAEVSKSLDPNETSPYYDYANNWVPDGNFTAFAVPHASLFVTADQIEQTQWWGRQNVSSIEAYYGRPLNALSGINGEQKLISSQGAAFGFGILRVTNQEKSRDYFGLPTSYGIPILPDDLSHNTPSGIQIDGPLAQTFQIASPPYLGHGYPSGGSVLGITCGPLYANANYDLPCAHNVFPTFNIWNTHLGGTSVDTSMLVNPATGAVTVNASSFNVGNFTAAAFNTNNILLGNNGQYGKMGFSRDGTTYVANWSNCSLYGSTTSLCLNATNTVSGSTGDAFVATGSEILGSSQIQNSLQANNLSSGRPYAVGMATAPTYTGIAGAIPRRYWFVIVNSLGQEGVVNPGSFDTVTGTFATLDGTHFVTITCPTALQAGANAGDTYFVYGQNLTSTVISRVAACPVGTTIADTGVGTLPLGLPLQNANSTMVTGGISMAAVNGDITWPTSIWNANQLVGLSNTATGISVDTLTHGNGLGTLKSGAVSITGTAFPIVTGSAGNTDLVGELAFAAATTATYAFSSTPALAIHPECLITAQATTGTSGTPYATYTGVASFTINFPTAFTGNVSYHCIGRN